MLNTRVRALAVTLSAVLMTLTSFSEASVSTNSETKEDKLAGPVEVKAPKEKDQKSEDNIAPTLKISGYTIFNGYHAHQNAQPVDTNDSNYDARTIHNGFDQTTHASIDKTDLAFEVAGKTQTNFTYKYKILLRAMPASSAIVKNNYIEVGGSFGTFQFGNLSGPEETMKNDSASIAGGAGGFDGVWTNAFAPATGVMTGNSMIGSTGDATKLVYYTPDLNGFKFGAAWTPNTSHLGGNGMKSNDVNGKDTGNGNLYFNKVAKPFGKDNITLGMEYKLDNGPWNFKWSSSLVFDRSYIGTNLSRKDQYEMEVQGVRSYQLGMILGYRDWKFAAGWIDNGGSRLLKDINSLSTSARNDLINKLATVTSTGGVYRYKLTSDSSIDNIMYMGDAGKLWNVGAQFTKGIYQYALTYQSSRRKLDNESKALGSVLTGSITAQPLPGLKVYAEVNVIDTKFTHKTKDWATYFESLGGSTSTKIIQNNRGAIVVVGAKLSF